MIVTLTADWESQTKTSWYHQDALEVLSYLVDCAATFHSQDSDEYEFHVNTPLDLIEI